jgi:uncharacterized integral membrane protein
MHYQGNPLDPIAKRVGGLLLTYYLLRDAMIPLLLLFFGCIGLAYWCASRRGLQAAMLGSQLLLLALLTFLGSEWQVTRNLEPLRFQVPLGLGFCLAAGEGILLVFTNLAPQQLWGQLTSRLRWTCAAIVLGLAVAVTFPSMWWARIGLDPKKVPPSSWRMTSGVLQSARPLAVGLRPEMIELVDWIRQNTDTSARILFEDQLRLLENADPSAPESIHWTPLLPILTGRQFVGGLYHLAFIPHRHAAFGDWSLAGRNIRAWSDDDLLNFLEQYNVGWVVTWSRASPFKQGPDYLMPLSTDIFSRMDFCELVARIPRHTTREDEAEYAIFRVLREPNFFAKGLGRVVQADFNRIELADLEPDRGELVLRYHWQPEFTTEPPITLARADVPGDPVGFIQILAEQPLKRLVLTNTYRARGAGKR